MKYDEKEYRIKRNKHRKEFMDKLKEGLKRHA
jgi:hypothetical protein